VFSPSSAIRLYQSFAAHGGTVVCVVSPLLAKDNAFIVRLSVGEEDLSRQARINACLPDDLMFCACLLRMCRTGGGMTSHHAPFDEANLPAILSITDIFYS
jgi:hypothetical protein